MEQRVLDRAPVNRKGYSRRLHARGFTLVELAVVVTIVAVLSVIALVGYRRYMLNAKVTEAQQMINAIKLAQEDHKSEKGTYANIGDSNWCPAGAGNAKQKWAWDPGCDGGGGPWRNLAVHVEGPVQFVYQTTAGTGTFKAPTESTFVKWNTTTSPAWYTVVAKCDLDDTDTSLYTVLVGSSLDNRIFSNNVGE
jgi:prepilin-type N-terminal cleavage/methylation domain-containing protein